MTKQSKVLQRDTMNSNLNNETSKEIKELKDTQVQIVEIISRMSEKSEKAHNAMLNSMHQMNHQIKLITLIILVLGLGLLITAIASYLGYSELKEIIQQELIETSQPVQYMVNKQTLATGAKIGLIITK